MLTGLSINCCVMLMAETHTATNMPRTARPHAILQMETDSYFLEYNSNKLDTYNNVQVRVQFKSSLIVI